MRRMLAALLLTGCSFAAADETTYRPVNPQHNEFLPMVEWTLARAPADWLQMKLRYAFFINLGRTYIYATRAGSAQWQELGNSDFAPMDFFDAYRDRTHPGMARPWTAVMLVISRDTRQFDVSFCFATPKPEDIKLTAESMGC